MTGTRLGIGRAALALALAWLLLVPPAAGEEEAAPAEGPAAADGQAETSDGGTAPPDGDDPSVTEAVAGRDAGGPVPPEAPPEADGDEDGLRWAVEGYLRQDLRLRATDDETDVDLYTLVSADAVRRGGTYPVRVRFFGRLVADVAGDQDANDYLRDVWDTFDHDVQFRLYEAFGQIGKLVDGAVTVRAGRQFLDEGVYFHFDGVRVDGDLAGLAKNLDATVIFGVPVRFGEQERSEAWLAGLVARYRLDGKTRLRLEYYHVSEFFEGINSPVVDPFQQPVVLPAENIDDDLLGLSAWHRPLKTVRLFGRFTLLDGEANELHLRGRWFTEDGRWTVVVEYYQLFDRLNNVTNDLSPFVPLLGSYQPFVRLGGRVTRRVGDAWILQGGLAHRELESESDEGTFNHEYNHYYVTVTRLALVEGRLDLTLTGNGYTSSRNDVLALGGHADFRVSDEVELSGGVDYALYKYDWFSDTEREDVWTYSTRVRWKLRKKTTLEGGLTIDDDRFETLTTFLVRLTVRF